MSRYSWTLTTTALLLAATMAPAAAARAERPGRDGYGAYRYSDLRAAADHAEKLADGIRGQLDRELDRTFIDGTKREKQVEKNAAKLENALDDVRSSVRAGKKFNHTRSRVERALRYANELEQDLVRLRLSPRLHEDWRHLQGRLGQLAHYYELTPRHAAMPVRRYR